MAVQPTKLTLSIGAGPTSDQQELAELIQNLRQDLLETGAESVERVRGGAAPAGSKGDPITLAALAITLAPTALTGLINMLQSWLTRHERATLTLQRGDQKITATGTLSPEQQLLIRDRLHSEKAA